MAVVDGGGGAGLGARVAVNPWKRARRQQEFARDAAAHIEHETALQMERGLKPDEARLAALRKFGNRTLTQEAVYEMNSAAWLDNLGQDLRYGLRQLAAKPGFALAAMLSLALGIGANTAIFTLVDQIMLRLLPVERPEELVKLRVAGGRFGSNSGDGLHTFSYPTYVALRDRQSVFTGLTGQLFSSAAMTAGERSERVSVNLVAGNYFQLFGVRSHLGRLITPAEDVKPNGHPVAVLQYDFWRTRLAGRPGIVGETIRLNGTPFTVIGVAAPGFEGTNTGFLDNVWVPITMKPAITPADPELTNERYSWFYLFGRLKPGITRERAESAMRVLYRQRQDEELQGALFAKFPQMRERFLQQTFSLAPASQGDGSLRERFGTALGILQLLVGAVLLIACANVAGLMLARGAARQREMAIRGAIGAGRARLVRQLLTESTLLAIVGGCAGVLLGAWLTRVLIRSLPFDPANFSLSATPDPRILAFTFALTAITSLVFGLLPAWQNSRVSPAMTMREEAGNLAGSHGQVRLRKVFVGLQVALSVMLLLGAGLFVQTLRNLRNVELGMKTGDVVTFSTGPSTPYDDARKAQVYRAIMEELALVPGVKAVGANRQAIFTGGQSDGSITVPGVDEKLNPQSFFNWVTPGYLAALGIPLTAGRDFSWNDWNANKKIALGNEQLAQRYYAGASTVGRMFGRGMRVTPEFEFIGLFGPARYHDIRGEVPPQIFMLMDSNWRGISSVNVYARVTGDPAAAMPALRAAVARVDRNFVVWQMRMLDDQVATRVVAERLVSFLSAGFAALATVLAVVGLHGVLAFVVARRTREIGIRMALGAARGNVISLVSREMASVIAAGLAAGLAAGYYCGRYVESALFGVKAHDPLVFALALGALVVASAVAVLLPAWRASRIDPMSALRWE